MYQYTKTHGFTLIELSIVVVIIGLIVAGVVGGQTLVKQAKLRTVLQDVETYTAANRTFYLEYNHYAGDMPEAQTQAYWGVTNASGSETVPGDKKLTADGEGIRSWQQLQLAGYIGGNYDGVKVIDETPDVTVGRSGYSNNSGFVPHTLGMNENQWSYSNADVYDMRNKTAFHFGNVNPVLYNLVSYAALTPSEAHSIDEKIDDTTPHKGTILADHGNDPDVGSNQKCTSFNGYASAWNSSDGDIEYQLSNDEVACRMIFIFR